MRKKYRQTHTDTKRKRISVAVRRISLFSFGCFALTLVSYLSVTSVLSTQGYREQRAENMLEDLAAEGRDLQIRRAQLRSLSVGETPPEGFYVIAPESVRFVRETGHEVASR